MYKPKTHSNVQYILQNHTSIFLFKRIETSLHLCMSIGINPWSSFIVIYLKKFVILTCVLLLKSTCLMYLLHSWRELKTSCGTSSCLSKNDCSFCTMHIVGLWVNIKGSAVLVRYHKAALSETVNETLCWYLSPRLTILPTAFCKFIWISGELISRIITGTDNSETVCIYYYRVSISHFITIVRGLFKRNHFTLEG